MKRHNVVACPVVMLLVMLVSATCFAQFPLTDDAYVTPGTANNPGLASTNYGGSPYLFVQVPGTSAYVRFDLTVLPSGLTASNIQKANLRLYLDAITQMGSIDVHLVSQGWSESGTGGITYNNAPAWGALVASAFAIKPKKQFFDIDVTSAVTAWLSGTPNYGLVLSPTPNSSTLTNSVSVSFDAKENTNTSHNAELQLVLVSAGPQGPQGPQGIQGPPGTPGVNGLNGVNGTSPTIQVGTVTTLMPGSPATVTTGGNASAVMLNFGIPQGVAGTNGTSGSGGNVMMASAFMPGALSTPYTAADIRPNQGITVTRVTAQAKTAGANCTTPPVVRVTDGSTGQDLPFPGTVDSGAFALKFGANSDVQVKLQTAANCGTAPSDTNVLVEYKITDSADVNTCAQAGQACNGICKLTVTDPNNCGACGNTCSFANAASGGCVNSQCQLGVCNAGFADCDHNGANGCETNITNDVNNCGACGNACPYQATNIPAHTSGATCSGNQPTCGLNCDSGYAHCTGDPSYACGTNIAADPNNCGSCGNACPIASDTCSNTVCINNLPSGSVCYLGSECASGVCTLGTYPPFYCAFNPCYSFCN